MQVLKSFEFKSSGSTIKAVYEWDTILDGNIRKLEEGKDFKCKPQTFRMMAGKVARKRKLGVRVNKVDGGLVVQAFTPTDVNPLAPETNGDGANHTDTPAAEDTAKKSKKASKKSKKAATAG